MQGGVPLTAVSCSLTRLQGNRGTFTNTGGEGDTGEELGKFVEGSGGIT